MSLKIVSPLSRIPLTNLVNLQSKVYLRSISNREQNPSTSSRSTRESKSAASKREKKPTTVTTSQKEEYETDFTVTSTTYSYTLPSKIDDADEVLAGGNLFTGFLEVLGVKNPTGVSEAKNTEFDSLKLVTSRTLSRKKDRPKRVKMLTSDFIEDSLYHPDYGYFSKQVEIFHTNKPFNYGDITDVDDFMSHWKNEYNIYAKDDKEPTPTSAVTSKNSKKTITSKRKADSKDSSKKQNQYKDYTKLPKSTTLQLWHTPTELFQPYYGEALARYLIVNYKLTLYPYKDLIIYEMGGGNGTLMLNILDFIAKNQPDVYSRTQYRIIEISKKLAEKQEANALLLKAESSGHKDKVEIINASIFDWKPVVRDPCFFIALEVLDNFAHDVIRYDNITGRPYQGYVGIDSHGEYSEYYTPDLNDWSKRFLYLRERGEFSKIPKTPSKLLWKGEHPLQQPEWFRNAKNKFWPFRGRLSDPEYLPTRYLEFLYILKNKFPEHRLLMSDFTTLPDSIPGYQAPVVQTVLDGRMVTTSTYMCLQGFFDIIFPTDFDVASDLYKQVCGKLVNKSSHRDFLEQWADLDDTSTKRGENPMLSFYQNAAFLYS